jgi:hypothetical protein
LARGGFLDREIKKIINQKKERKFSKIKIKSNPNPEISLYPPNTRKPF